MKLSRYLPLLASAAFVIPSIVNAAGPKFAVFGQNAMYTELNAYFGAGSATIVSDAQIATPGFLNSFDALVFTRDGASFGTYLSASAAAQVTAYVGAAGSANQGGVAIFTNDMADNLKYANAGDPFDSNLDKLFLNAATYAAQSHHGFIGEFNGAAQAVASNNFGKTPLNLLAGSSNSPHGFGPDFTYDVGPIGAGNPIDAGVSFPFTDSDHTTFLTDIINADPNNIVDIYTNDRIKGEPAVLANSYVIHGGDNGVPDAASTGLLALMSLAGLAAIRSRIRR